MQEKNIEGNSKEAATNSSDEKMYYMDAVTLIEKCIAHDILHTVEEKPNLVLVYRKTQENEGWYAESIEDLAQELMNDFKGQTVLREALAKKGISFEEEFKHICKNMFCTTKEE